MEKVSSNYNFRLVGEGNDHCVISIINTGYVLRIKKVACNKEHLISEENLFEQCSKDLKFLNHVARRMFGPLLVVPGKLVKLSNHQLCDIRFQLKNNRANERLHKDINPYGIAIMCSDATSHFNLRTTRPFKQQSSSDSNGLEKVINKFSDDSHSNNIIQHQNEFIDEKKKVEKVKLLYLLSQCSNGRNLKSISNGFLNANTYSMLKNICSMEHKKEEKSRKVPNTICIELKPKQGFLEPTESTSMNICRFCMKQFIKHQKGSVQKRTGYCPLQLFSGNENLMKSALQELFSCPQNNLKIFKDGVNVEPNNYFYLCDIITKILLYCPYKSTSPFQMNTSKVSTLDSIDSGHNSDCEDNLMEDIAREFNFHLSCNNQSENVHKMHSKLSSDSLLSMKSLCSSNSDLDMSCNRKERDTREHHIINEPGDPADKFPTGSILNLVLRSQQSQFSVVEAYKAYDFLMNTEGESETRKLLNNVQIDEHCSPSELLSICDTLPSLINRNCDKSDSVRDKDVGGGVGNSEIVRKLQEFLRALTFKDCSLMLLLSGPFAEKPLDMTTPEDTTFDGSPFWIESSKGVYRCQVTVIDLVSKDVGKISHHFRAVGQLTQLVHELKREGQTVPSCCL